LSVNGRVLVLGGGPAGMMAAITAGRLGADVVLLEKNAAPGQKLLLTGNGRCNLSNQADLETLIAKTPGNGRFLYSAFSRFNPDALRSFFRELDLETKIEEGGRIFPGTDSSRDVLAALLHGLEKAGVTVAAGNAVTELLCENGQITGVRTSVGVCSASAVIIATGGMSYPATGSTGDGYGLAGSVGHQIIAPRPALVPLTSPAVWIRGLQGLSLRQIRADLTAAATRLLSRSGELIFTHYGVSGPLILDLSRTAVTSMRSGAAVVLHLDLTPDLGHDALDKQILAVLAARPNGMCKNALGDLLPARLAEAIIGLAGLRPETSANRISREERGRIAAFIKDLVIPLSGARPLAEAIVTAGGVAVTEVSPRTMASRLIRGLYLAGEVLDIDGETGGFNLQAAFSSGRLAGESAALGQE